MLRELTLKICIDILIQFEVFIVRYNRLLRLVNNGKLIYLQQQRLLKCLHCVQSTCCQYQFSSFESSELLELFKIQLLTFIKDQQVIFSWIDVLYSNAYCSIFGKCMHVRFNGLVVFIQEYLIGIDDINCSEWIVFARVYHSYCGSYSCLT